MLNDLEALAAEIANLSKACAEMEGTEAAMLLSQVIAHLEVALSELAEHPGMLVGDMPWWISRQSERNSLR
ncbi:conserved hypothetical protein [Sphingomonas aurantiaca]|jgi:hypothetical protein|uniref:Uncharacterized protein n=1 Tax=Sphingomonas aurantiaca TaxID=185949 RepID=A0A5E7XSI6_9SPHN|nr:hypothetical protein [Sphingomonas aurantiaca]VVS97196.1 conserved hypothetical protein [Sphingomonas aurantiaca]